MRPIPLARMPPGHRSDSGAEVSAKTIVCDVCGESAIVHSIHYQYDRQSWPTADVDQYILAASMYQLSCPNCGDRVQTEPAFETTAAQTGLTFMVIFPFLSCERQDIGKPAETLSSPVTKGP